MQLVLTKNKKILKYFCEFNIDLMAFTIALPGLYIIYLKATKAAYIGESNNIAIRLVQHFASLEKGNHSNENLQKDYKLNGCAGFELWLIVNWLFEVYNVIHRKKEIKVANCFVKILYPFNQCHNMKNKIEIFFPKDEIIIKCLDLIKDHIKESIEDFQLILDPSSGNGLFIKKVLEQLNKKGNSPLLLSVNLESKEVNTRKSNFFKISAHSNLPLKIVFISKIPFGTQGSTAQKIIEHCCSRVFPTKIGSLICFILPKGFLKPSMQTCFASDWHLISNTELPLNGYLYEDKEFKIPTIYFFYFFC